MQLQTTRLGRLLFPKKFKEVVDASTFIERMRTRKNIIETTRYIFPQPGPVGNGKFEITYKYNPDANPIEASASSRFTIIWRKYGF